jgi:hypothetical protein
VSLLASYLRAVQTFLPKRADQQDLLNELSSHLQAKLDEREEALGRALTEDEQAAVLSAYGNPLTVAERYGATNAGLAFGRVLIGPEVFPLYRLVLFSQFALTVIVVTAIGFFGAPTTGGLGRYLWPMAMQFVMTTTIFMAIDVFRRRSPSGSLWNFPPPHMQSVPRWQSMSGFIVLSLVAIWWASIPYAPFLLLGSASDQVTFLPSWHAFYWPMLAPLLVGAAQRLITYADPGRAALQAVTRLLTNSWSVLMAALFLFSYPYVAASGANGEAIAQRVNNSLWWNAMASFGLYWLIGALFAAWQCWQHAAHAVRRRREQLALHRTVHS